MPLYLVCLLSRPALVPHQVPGIIAGLVQYQPYQVPGIIAGERSWNGTEGKITSEESETSPERFQPALSTMNDQTAQNAIASLEARLSKMQNILQHQNDVIAELTADCTTYPTTTSNPFADDIKCQFLKSPLKFYKEVNPRKSILSFDGSNYVEWEITVDRALQHAFVLEKTFLNDETDRFLGLDLLENKAVAALMRSTLDDALLSIVESQELSSSKELFNLLWSKCQRSGRRHKIILVEKMLRFASDNLPASKSWLAQFCSIMSDFEHAKLTIDEFGGLFLQSLAKAPPGADAKNFEYSVIGA
ncbi:hypothetical protein VP01_570g2 [Puccinia sorghi]|uniref:Uncharacterized protein n=1 Tax=Puccinia sorghi TaxID=27349 RepID=A0A0L6UKQ2_9BASI|nr:hypothetical protein VP01_570g2 [Puccinia sorghi]